MNIAKKLLGTGKNVRHFATGASWTQRGGHPSKIKTVPERAIKLGFAPGKSQSLGLYGREQTLLHPDGSKLIIYSNYPSGSARDNFHSIEYKC